MWKKIFAFLVIAVPYSLHSADAQRESWGNLGELRPGERIEIVDAKMKSHKGEFVAYTQAGIALRLAGGEMTIPREEVASVKLRGESRRGRNLLLGLAIGASGGLAIGAIRGKTYHEAGETAVFMAVWTPIGAAIGAAAGAASPARGQITVYRARAVRR